MLCLASISAMIFVVKGLHIGGDYCLEVSRTDPALGSLFEIVHKCRVKCETMPASAVGHAGRGRGVRGGGGYVVYVYSFVCRRVRFCPIARAKVKGR